MCEPIELRELLELREISLKLREFAARLQEFEDKHVFATAMKDSLDKCIKELDQTHHFLDIDIYKMKQENDL